jgi:hypothetical protein
MSLGSLASMDRVVAIASKSRMHVLALHLGINQYCEHKLAVNEPIGHSTGLRVFYNPRWAKAVAAFSGFSAPGEGLSIAEVSLDIGKLLADMFLSF